MGRTIRYQGVVGTIDRFHPCALICTSRLQPGTLSDIGPDLGATELARRPQFNGLMPQLAERPQSKAERLKCNPAACPSRPHAGPQQPANADFLDCRADPRRTLAPGTCHGRQSYTPCGRAQTIRAHTCCEAPRWSGCSSSLVPRSFDTAPRSLAASEQARWRHGPKAPVPAVATDENRLVSGEWGRANTKRRTSAQSGFRAKTIEVHSL